VGLCLALAPAGAWVAIAADAHGWAAITGMLDGRSEFLWYPEVFFISFGVALWIAAFDINYALMDQDADRKQGVRSFPASYGLKATRNLSVALTIGWLVCFLLTGLHDFTDRRTFRYTLWIPSVVLMSLINIFVMTKGSRAATESDEAMGRFQKTLFRASMLTGWALLAGLMFVESYIDGLED
jgi:4-hydroxybenzoate polyprenyltransferase